MSTTTNRFRVALAAATLVVALTGGIASAFAQSNGGGRGGGDSSDAGNGSSSGSAVITYGTVGNCPPTIACGNPTPRRPKIKMVRIRDVCGDYYRPGTVAYRQCLKGD